MKKTLLGLMCVYSTLGIAASKVDIAGLDKKIVLNALYQRAQTQGLGIFNDKPDHILSDVEAEKILKINRGNIDYLYGRVMKVNLSGDFLDTRLYNRDNGDDAAEEVIKELRRREKENKKN